MVCARKPERPGDDKAPLTPRSMSVRQNGKLKAESTYPALRARVGRRADALHGRASAAGLQARRDATPECIHQIDDVLLVDG